MIAASIAKPRNVKATHQGMMRSEENTGATQVEQAHTVGWRLDSCLKRVRTGAGAECFSVAEEASHADRRTTTPEKP
jgi:hypothetical protein